MRFTIREALPAELDDAGDVAARAYEALPGLHHPEYYAQIRDARGRARDCAILVAIDDASGDVLGSVSYVADARNPYAELQRDGEAGFRMLGVAPEAQSHGVGEALVRACIDRARAAGQTGVAISTASWTEPAHRLYSRVGFQRVPSRDHEPVAGVRLWAYVLPLGDRNEGGAG